MVKSANHRKFKVKFKIQEVTFLLKILKIIFES